MKWSKLKQRVEERIAPSVKSIFAINSTGYGNCSCGHAWLTIDKEIVANFCTRAFWNRRPKFDENKQRFVNEDKSFVGPDTTQNVYAKQLTDYGELSRQDAYQACWDFVHESSIEEALKSEDPLIQSLAVLDTRVGKRKLQILDVDKYHPLAQRMLNIRKEAENLSLKENNKKETGQDA